jgi:hypothetical protein
MSTSTMRRNQTFNLRAAPAPALGGTLGVIALALGIGVFGAYALDLHSHTCASCGYKWRHLGAFNLGDPAAHTCRNCGNEQWWKCGFGMPARATQSVVAQSQPKIVQQHQQHLALLAGEGTPIPAWPARWRTG